MDHNAIRQMVGKPDPIILEIGSNDGTDTLEFLRQFPGARVFCFEPEPRAIAKWRANVTDTRAQLFEVALDQTNGESTFHRSGGKPPNKNVNDWDMSGSLCKPTGHLSYSPWCTFKETITVKTICLDGWWEQMGSPLIDFIWLDVQGAERRVLVGGAKMLQQTKFIKLECHQQSLYAGQPTETELKMLLADWICVGRNHADLLFRNGKLT